MRVLINPRSVARLAAASIVVVPLAPVAVNALTVAPAAPSRHTLLADGLCDGHKWSLFGCRPDPGHHTVHQPEADDTPSAD